MWEESYLSRKSESVFSWHVVSEWLSQLILKNEYHKKSAINISKDPGSMQLSFFDYGAFSGIQRIEPEAIKSVFTVSQELIDEVLCIGFNDKNSRLIIAAYFAKDKTAEENAEFLKGVYGENGAGIYFRGEKVSVWYDQNGIRIGYGESVKGKEPNLSWQQAASESESFWI